MPDQVQLQSDVGALGLQGLGAFSVVLAALSADNIAPMAMIQMEQLGSAFNVNGSFAAKVPESLCRSSSHPLGRLAVAVGWRRGDSISYLAESAGGQAVSLLSVCLTNIYRTVAVGEILSRLCYKLLPKTLPIASVVHLADVATLLASKTNRLGFGNLLAGQAIRVLSAYENLGIAPPGDLLETPSTQSIVDVFDCLSHLTEDDSIIRIRGSYGIGHILGIILFMFPLDATVTVESFVIHEGPNRRIVIETCTSQSTQIQVEKQLGQPPFLKLPIKSPEAYEKKITGHCSFEWQGWLARKLQLEFARFGAICTQDVLASCCNLLVLLPPRYRSSYNSRGVINLPSRGIEGFMGPYSRTRMDQTCQEVFLVTPEQPEADFETSWTKFASTLEQAVEKVRCACFTCDFSKAWPGDRAIGAQLSCPRSQLWEIVGKVLTAGLYCFTVNVRGPIAVTGKLPSNTAGKIVSQALFHEVGYLGTAEDFFKRVLGTFSGRTGGLLGRSSRGCTIFPAVLETFEAHNDGVFDFELLDGVFVFENRYHYELNSIGATRPRATRSLLSAHTPITPSNCGVHSTIEVTLREGYNELVLQVTAGMSGSYVRIDIASTIITYIGLERTRECEHRPDTPLSEQYRDKVTVTGVNMPRTMGKKLSLAMARSNPAAQLLCCETGVRCILLQGCCLDCGVEQAIKDHFDILIIS